MRVLTAIVSVLLLTACGSGAPTDAKPVPVVLVPTTVAVTSGDGQQALPGASLTIKPVVTVKDASGQPVPGTSVAFAIDSGGGSLQAAMATTASDGTASPGDWTMGPTEARNVLRVTVGALPPVRILALGAMAPVTIADQTVGSGGGTIAVTTVGSPLNGLKIVVPAGAFAAGQTVGITYGSNLGTDLPQRSVAISPLLTLRVSDGGWAPKPLFITIPAVTPAGMSPTVLLRDPVSGRRLPLTTVSFTATSVTAVAAHLNGALIWGSAGNFGNSRIASGKTPTPAAVSASVTNAVVIALPLSILEMDHDTGFRPGIDNWEFRPIGTIAARNIDAAMVSTEAWYYLAQKRAGGPLWKKYQEADGIEESNRRGLRWVSVADVALRGTNAQTLAEIYSTLVLDAVLRNPDQSREFHTLVIHRASFNSVRTALTISPGSPQRAALFSNDSGVPPVSVLVFRSTGDRLFAVDPGNPSATLTLDFPSGISMTPVTLGAAPARYDFIISEGFGLLADVPVLQSQWASVVDGTIGNSLFPTYEAKVGWGASAAETTNLADPVFVFGDADRVNIWADCVTCIGEPRPATFAPGAAQVARFAGFQRAPAAAAWVSLGVGTRLGAAETSAFGLALFTKKTPTSDFEWTDWKSFATRRLPATITPAAPTVDLNTDVALTLTVTGAPGNLEYLWDFADGTPPTTTAVANATHQWSAGGTYAVKVTARDKSTKQPVAKASNDITIAGSVIAWKFNTMSVAFSTAGPNVTSDGRWLLDSARFVRMMNGGSQGGIRLVERAFAASGFPVRTAAEGLYILEGASLTSATVNYPLNNNTFASVQFAGAPLTLAASPQVYGWQAVRALQITPEPYCKDPSESFVRTGSATSGRVAGLTVQYCWDRFNPPQPGFEYLVGPRITIATDVTFSGTTATGTLTLTYLFQQPTVIQKKIATVTFTATRL